MKIHAVIGSRTYTNYKELSEVLEALGVKSIVSGGARGADALAARFAVENNLTLKVFEADWSRYGKGAGFRRNISIIDYCDEVVAFWDGFSKGTKHSLTYAESRKKPITLIDINND